MPNFLKPAKQALLRRLLADGESVRKIARAVGCAKPTVGRYAKLYRVPVLCPCGKDSRHNGWCSWRYLRSPARQAWIQSYHANRPKAAPKPKFQPLSVVWPFRGDDALVERINGIVPKWLPEQARQEVCQDMAVALLSGSGEAELKTLCAQLTKQVYREYPQKWGPLSIDAPIRGTDGLTIKDTLVAPDGSTETW